MNLESARVISWIKPGRMQRPGMGIEGGDAVASLTDDNAGLFQSFAMIQIASQHKTVLFIILL